MAAKDFGVALGLGFAGGAVWHLYHSRLRAKTEDYYVQYNKALATHVSDPNRRD